VSQYHIQAETRHLENQRLWNRHRFLIRSGISPGDHHFLAAQVPTFLFDDGHQVRQALKRMVNVALHIQNRHPGSFCHFIEVAVADTPIDVADGDAVKITAKDFADLLGGITVGDLGGLALNESAVAPQLCHASLK
jgi:hypothetical protein